MCQTEWMSLCVCRWDSCCLQSFWGFILLYQTDLCSVIVMIENFQNGVHWCYLQYSMLNPVEYFQGLFLFPSDYTGFLKWKTCWLWCAHCCHLNNAPLEGDTMPLFSNLGAFPPLWLEPVRSVFAWKPRLEFSTVSQFTLVWGAASERQLTTVIKGKPASWRHLEAFSKL